MTVATSPHRQLHVSDTNVAALGGTMAEGMYKPEASEIQERNRIYQRKTRARRKDKMSAMQQQLDVLQANLTQMQLEGLAATHTIRSLIAALDSNSHTTASIQALHAASQALEPSDCAPMDMTFLASYPDAILTNRGLRDMTFDAQAALMTAIFDNIVDHLQQYERDASEAAQQAVHDAIQGSHTVWCRCVLVEPVRTREIERKIRCKAFAVRGEGRDSMLSRAPPMDYLQVTADQMQRMGRVAVEYTGKLNQVLQDRAECHRTLARLQPDPGNEYNNRHTFCEASRVIERLSATVRRENALHIQRLECMKVTILTPLQLSRFVFLYDRPVAAMMNLCQLMANNFFGPNHLYHPTVEPLPCLEAGAADARTPAASECRQRAYSGSAGAAPAAHEQPGPSRAEAPRRAHSSVDSANAPAAAAERAGASQGRPPQRAAASGTPSDDDDDRARRDGQGAGHPSGPPLPAGSSATVLQHVHPAGRAPGGGTHSPSPGRAQQQSTEAWHATERELAAASASHARSYVEQLGPAGEPGLPHGGAEHPLEPHDQWPALEALPGAHPPCGRRGAPPGGADLHVSVQRHSAGGDGGARSGAAECGAELCGAAHEGRSCAAALGGESTSMDVACDSALDAGDLSEALMDDTLTTCHREHGQQLATLEALFADGLPF